MEQEAISKLQEARAFLERVEGKQAAVKETAAANVRDKQRLAKERQALTHLQAELDNRQKVLDAQVAQLATQKARVRPH